MDIVERLRSANASMGVRDPEKYICPLTVADANRAADEIERLRAELVATQARYELRLSTLGAAIELLRRVMSAPHSDLRTLQHGIGRTEEMQWRQK